MQTATRLNALQAEDKSGEAFIQGSREALRKVFVEGSLNPSATRLPGLAVPGSHFTFMLTHVDYSFEYASCL